MKAPQCTLGTFAVAVLVGFVVLVLTWPVLCEGEVDGQAIFTCHSIVAIPSPDPPTAPQTP
jgi:hypothetical protein